MAYQTVLFCTLLTLSTTLSQDHACCSVKVVTGTGELGMDGVYTYSQTNQGRDSACADGCVYSREGRVGEEYCFQAVEDGARIEDVCGSTGKLTTGINWGWRGIFKI